MTSSHFRACLAAAVASLSQYAVAAAQTAEGSHPAFDVATIKPTEGQPINSGFRRATGGGLNATNVTVKFLIEYAWSMREDQISGGPGWLGTDRYEVVAKPADPDPANDPELTRLRTQALLAERFHLIVSHKTKEATVLALVVAKNGPRGLKESKSGRTDWVTNGHHLTSERMSMASFAGEFLARTLARTVIDRTGISGVFDFTLDWSPDDAQADGNAAAAAAQMPPLLVAIQEQLGLRLEQQKGQEEYIVVERAEKPTEN